MGKTAPKKKNAQKERVFLADGTCGDIARLLRSAGYDVTYSGSPNPQLLALALKEDRLLLTRSQSLAEKAKDTALLLPEGLTASVSLLYNRGLISLQEPCSRCLTCNQLLLFIPKKDIRHLVPPYVYDSHTRFLICPECRKVFWGGTHLERMVDRLYELLPDKAS
jgi:uncharacterized protein with PIN domain